MKEPQELKMFLTLEDCQSSLVSVRYVNIHALVCISRDNDGRDPYLLVSLQGLNIQRYPNTSGRKESCNNLLRSLRPDRNNIAYVCVARDNDGRAPFVASALDLNSGVSQNGTETFQTISACQEFLGQ